MSNYRKLIPMVLSGLLIPLAKAALSKIVDRAIEKKDHDPYDKESEGLASNTERPYRGSA